MKQRCYKNIFIFSQQLRCPFVKVVSWYFIANNRGFTVFIQTPSTICPRSGVGTGVVVTFAVGGDKMGSNHNRSQLHSTKLPIQTKNIYYLKYCAIQYKRKGFSIFNKKKYVTIEK